LVFFLLLFNLSVIGLSSYFYCVDISKGTVGIQIRRRVHEHVSNYTVRLNMVETHFLLVSIWRWKIKDIPKTFFSNDLFYCSYFVKSNSIGSLGRISLREKKPQKNRTTLQKTHLILCSSFQNSVALDRFSSRLQLLSIRPVSLPFRCQNKVKR